MRELGDSDVADDVDARRLGVQQQPAQRVDIGPHEACPVEPSHHRRVVAADESGAVGERGDDFIRRRQREHWQHRLARAEGEGGEFELADHRVVVRPRVGQPARRAD